MELIVDGFVAWVVIGLVVAFAMSRMARYQDERGPIPLVVGVVGALVMAGVIAPLAGFTAERFLGFDPIHPGLNVGSVIAAVIGAALLFVYIRKIGRR